jgi:hypothetical protein
MANKRQTSGTDASTVEISVTVRLTRDEHARLERVGAKLGYRGVSAFMRSSALIREAEVMGAVPR